MPTNTVAWLEAPVNSAIAGDGRTGVSYADAAKNQDGSTDGISGLRSPCSNRGGWREEHVSPGRLMQLPNNMMCLEYLGCMDDPKKTHEYDWDEHILELLMHYI